MRSVGQEGNDATTITEQALDQLEGTLHDVTSDSVQFEVDGTNRDIRREKLEGLVYYQPAKREFPPPLCRLIDAGGSTWALRDVRLSGDRIAATTVGGMHAELPASQVQKIDFSLGNISFLADLEADSGAGESPVSLQPAAMTHKFSRLFQMRPSPPLGADAFRIGGERYATGLSLHSPAKLVYRVPEGFRWFRAVAGVDDSVLSPGRFELIILGDGTELARHSFSGDEPRQAVAVKLDVRTVRRISIILDPLDGQDIGDQLDLCEARFTK
jgi:hypothetical protein